jgi:hypothetical protein
MGMKYTKVAADAFEKLVMNAGIIADSFTPETAVVGNILAATTGGLQFATNPTYTDFGEDVDNVPNNTKQLLRITAFDPVLSGTMLTVDADIIKAQIGAADKETPTSGGVTKITPRATLEDEDFDDIWFIADYSDVNTGNSAGFVAIHIMNAMNRTGFQLQTGKNAKGQSTFEYHGHYDITDEDQTPPFEIYVKKGAA